MNTVRKICKMEGICYDRKVADGLENLEKYYSTSEKKELNIMDMNLGHVLRAFSKTLEENNKLRIKLTDGIDSASYKEGWNNCWSKIQSAILE